MAGIFGNTSEDRYRENQLNDYLDSIGAEPEFCKCMACKEEFTYNEMHHISRLDDSRGICEECSLDDDICNDYGLRDYA